MGKRHTEIHEQDVYDRAYNDELQQSPVVVVHRRHTENGNVHAKKQVKSLIKKDHLNDIAVFYRSDAMRRYDGS
jgi:disulfide oxidoreductase YuzD